MPRRQREFTTYLNIEPGREVDRNLAVMEQKTARTLKNIQANAAAATAAATGVRPGTAGDATRINTLAAAERRRGQAITATARAENQAMATSQRYAAAATRQGAAAGRAALQNERLARALRGASIAANVAQGPLGPIAGRLSALAVAVNSLSGFRFGLVGAGAAAASFVRFASAAQDLKAQLRPLFESQNQVNAAFADTRRIADNARVSLQPVVDLYSRLTLAGRDVGLTQARVSRLTEIASKAAKLSGGTGVSQEAGLYQFAQGIGSGALQGDELRSVRENTLRLAKAIADGMGVTIGELKAMGAEGELTAQKIADALESQADKIDEELSRLPVTISSATAKLGTAWIDFISQTDEATGFVGAFAEGLAFLADNLGTVVKSIGALVIGYASLRATNIAGSTLKDVAAWDQKRTAIQKANIRVREAAKASQATAQADRVASAQRIANLRQVRAELQQQIAAEQRLATEQRRLALSQGAAMAGRRGDASTGAQWQAYRANLAAARKSADQLARSQQQLSVVGSRLRAETATLVTATGKYRSAATQASTAARTFGRGMRNLVLAINPVGIALAVGINLLIAYAFRADEAASAADRMAMRQNELARFVDFTTGKIREQNQALVQQKLLTLEAEAAEARLRYQRSRGRVAEMGGDQLFVGGAGGGAGYASVIEQDPRIKRVISQFERRGEGRITASQAAAQLRALRDQDPSIRGRVDPIIEELATFVANAQDLAQANAAARVLGGQGSAEDLRRTQGNFTGEDMDGLTSALAGNTDEKKKNTKATKDLAAEEERLAAARERLSDRRADILARYDESPKAIDRAIKDIRELQQIVGENIDFRDAFGTVTGQGIYTAEMAEGDRQRIFYGLRQPIRDAIEEQERGLEISQLRADGYELEASVLERALEIQRDIGRVTEEEYETLLDNERQQLRINDALESRQRQVGLILDLANQTRDSFEETLVSLRKDPVGALKNFADTTIDNIFRIQARQLTERIFEGADERLRELVQGRDGVSRATDILARNVTAAAEGVEPVISAQARLADETLKTATAMAQARGILTGTPAGLQEPSLTAGGISLSGGLQKIVSLAGGKAGNVSSLVSTGAPIIGAIFQKTLKQQLKEVFQGPDITAGGDIIVTAQRQKSAGVPSGSAAINEIGAAIAQNLGISGPIADILGAAGFGFEGAGYGSLVGTGLNLLGIKQSGTGSAIGGAIGGIAGSFLPGIGTVIGSLIGGALGGIAESLFGGADKGVVAIGGTGSQLSLSGTKHSDSAQLQAANQAGGIVIDAIERLAEAVGGEINAAAASVTIGMRDDDYVVDTLGQGRTKGEGVLNFGEDANAAVAAAVKDLIVDGVLTGISQASQNILNGATDLERAIEKVILIEGLENRLLAKKDPTQYAVNQLNLEFGKIVDVLREAGASPEQFAQARELYDLELADILNQSNSVGQQTADAIQGFLNEIRGGSRSPLNAYDTYQAARETFLAFQGDIAAGNPVDSQALLAAASNFQDASRALYGSEQAFFDDYYLLQQLLETARLNALDATVTGAIDNSGNPFADIGTDLVDATNLQTNEVTARLDTLIYLQSGGTVRAPSTVNSLPIAS